jgi:hypothetical protein
MSRLFVVNYRIGKDGALVANLNPIIHLTHALRADGSRRYIDPFAFRASRAKNSLVIPELDQEPTGDSANILFIWDLKFPTDY